MRSHEFVSEIERIPKSAYSGGKSYLKTSSAAKQFKPLPGGSGLQYSIEDPRGEPTVKIWDPTVMQPDPRPVRSPYEYRDEYERRFQSWKNRQLEGSKGVPTVVGKLTLERPWFPLPNALQVGTITVDEDYRGQGIAKALYGIVLTILKRPLVAGESQTPGGRQNWVSLSQIPGVQMKGYVALEEEDLETNPRINDPRQTEQATQNIDVIMGKLGGDYIGNKSGREFFAFDVKPTTNGKELEAYVNTNLSKVYHSSYLLTTGLYAVWTGQ